MAKQQWLLLRGLCRESRHWGAFPEQMQKHLPNTQVSCIDLPGNGKRYRHPCPTSINELINDLHRRHRPEQPVYLLGLSLGGMIAYHWMQEYPDDLRGVVLLNSSLSLDSSLPLRLQPGAWPKLIRAMLSTGYSREKALFDLTCESPHAQQEILSFWQMYQLEYPLSFSNVRRQLQLAMQCGTQPYPPKKPVLLLSSENDKLVNPRCSEQLASAWRMPHRQHPKAGHDLPHDQPDWLIRQLQEWLKG
ncbi:alpha/beta hydrolase [Amphritea sp. 1_MG-2023]|uniref:alpha/beta fold hydrolase n=1 Tax=Amphritea sp. 1_MG-2023 TaxID=3062670 RepID=UPI0026E4782E|nr:alpha/beta hydrolase [Amphritea sp. 1_MG-2023]MDO6561771.1 alpha/beta hydrolase [Amphritea sp. 1_MG-2023]